MANASFLTDVQEYAEIFNHCEPILIGYGGSIAYGTNLPTSDVDVRGIYMNPLDEFVGCRPVSEQYNPSGSDVTIYSLKKIFGMLLQCNPNVIEMLGLRPEHYLYIKQEGTALIDNAEIFLSKRATYTFGNYAKSQLNRLMNKSGRAAEQVLANEVRSLSKAIASIRKREGVEDIRVDAVDGMPTIAINATMPIDQYARISNEICNVHADYKESRRNNRAVDHGKIAKHMMHLLRLYMMGIDILAEHRIVTYREAEHDLLMDIRNGKYLEEDEVTPTKEFDEILADYAAKFEEVSEKSTLPKDPDYSKANKLMMNIVTERYFPGCQKC